jgi:hypothetical protein
MSRSVRSPQQPITLAPQNGKELDGGGGTRWVVKLTSGYVSSSLHIEEKPWIDPKTVMLNNPNHCHAEFIFSIQR